MNNFIRELFFGNLQGQKITFDNNSEYGKTLCKIAKLETDLCCQLSGEEKQSFKAYIDSCMDLSEISELEAFENGFRLGASFMLDTFLLPDSHPNLIKAQE